MTNEEKYKQAFSVLHASGTISLEDNMNTEKSFRPSRKLVSLCVCSAMILALGLTAFANRTEIISHVFGWENNLEITQEADENGVITSTSILYTESLTEPVSFSHGKMLFVVNGENIDITDRISMNEPFRYEYTDDEGYTHYWFVGLNSDELDNYGYAEYIKDPAGEWAGGYSARVNIEPDGTTAAKWLEIGKAELDIPWGRTDILVEKD